LTNIVQRAAWLAGGGCIDAADLDTGPCEAAGSPAAGSPAAASATAAPPPLGAPCAPPPEAGLGQDLKERERELILATLRITGGSRKLAAQRLGISPRTLRHKLQQLKASGIAVPRLHDGELAAAASP
jgi:two-component system, response regulator FlrC